VKKILRTIHDADPGDDPVAPDKEALTFFHVSDFIAA